MTGRPLRLLYRWCRYEVIVSYGDDFGGRNDWLGMYLTRRGADRALANAAADPDGERPHWAVMLGIPKVQRGGFFEKQVLAVRDL